jgi:serine/threonine-protein kinase
MTDIPNYESFAKIEPLDKGMSSDKKYRIETRSGEHRLLRVSDIAEYDRKRAEFELLKRVAELGIPASRPVDFGTCDGGKSVYQLLTWIDGEELDTALPTMSETEQYAAGLKAGAFLRKLHSIPAPDGFADWAERYFAVIDERLDAYRDEGAPFEGSELMLAYLDGNRGLLKSRPQCRQHGDYHEGNLIISSDKSISVIDWHNVDFDGYGDPWYELGRCFSNIQYYAVGEIHGYFDGDPPEKFWRLFAYYSAVSAITSIVWAKYQAPEYFAEKLQSNLDILRWFDNFNCVVPSWYLQYSHIHVQYIPNYETFAKIEPLDKGWSSDKKYYIETHDGERLLLRVSDIAEYDHKRAEYEALGKAAALKLYTAQPIEFGTCGNGAEVYYLVTWLDGEDAAAMFPRLTDGERYALGIKSGELLRKLHSLSAPDNAEPWKIRFNRKIDERLSSYRHNNAQSEIGELAIKYLSDNAGLLENRPQTFNHGDFNSTNIIVAPGGEVGAVDFNCYNGDYGDPLWEMICISYMETPDPYYYTGLWNGYTGGKPDNEFFEMTAYYFAYDVLTSLSSGANSGFDNGGFEKKVFEWYDGFKRLIPSWYLKDVYIQYIDGLPVKLKAPFDLEFIHRYGKVFKVLEQRSGNLCLGVEKDGKRYFVKFAGAPTAYSNDTEELVALLRASAKTYEDLAHPSLIHLVNAEEIGGGFATVFDWTDAECAGRDYSASRAKFMALPLETRASVFEDIMEFHAHAAQRGYVAIDFYDASIMYDFERGKTVICDIDLYQKAPYTGYLGKWGSASFVSPEEVAQGAVMDEITTVHTMGQTAFALFSDSDRTPEKWPLDTRLYAVVKRAISDKRSERQQSIRQLIDEWSGVV